MVSRTQEHKNRTGQRNMKRRFTEDEIGVLWDGEGEEGSGLSSLTFHSRDASLHFATPRRSLNLIVSTSC